MSAGLDVGALVGERYDSIDLDGYEKFGEFSNSWHEKFHIYRGEGESSGFIGVHERARRVEEVSFAEVFGDLVLPEDWSDKDGYNEELALVQTYQ